MFLLYKIIVGGRIQTHNGPVLARGPYVWHPWCR